MPMVLGEFKVLTNIKVFVGDELVIHMEGDDGVQSYQLWYVVYVTSVKQQQMDDRPVDSATTTTCTFSGYRMG